MYLFRTEEKRRQTLIKMNAPKSDDMWMDMYDGIKENPYKIEEVLENKVWKVMYRAEDFAVTKVANRKMQGMFFGDPETPAYQNKLLASARKYGEACEEQVKKVILLNLDGMYIQTGLVGKLFHMVNRDFQVTRGQEIV